MKSGGSAQVLVKQQKFGQFPLQIHFWQQILRYHHRTVALDDTRLLEHAMLSGCTLSDGQAIAATADKSWHFHLGCFLEHYTGQQQLLRSFDVSSIIEKAKHWVAFRFFQDNNHSSLLLCRTLQPEYKYADYLSAVKGYSNRRLLDRFRSGCHGLRVDTRCLGSNVHLDLFFP